ncbi:MAG: hypothetical protein NVS3B16_16840 [Vulcanimicrobiaceae bacterium]
MMLGSMRTIVVACATFGTTLLPLAASAADDAMSMQTAPCSKAAVAMGASLHSGDAMKADAMKADAMKTDAMKANEDITVDAAYAKAMASHAKAMMEMSRLEMRCGKDAKTKSSAERNLPDLQRILNTLTIF